MEEWRDVAGYEGLYMVSSEGRILSLDRIDANGRRWPEKVMKTSCKEKRGYESIDLTKNGHKKKARVHRIVAEAFFGKIPDNLEVNHIDGVPSNNRLENLELCTGSENSIHSYRKLGRKSSGGHKGKTGGMNHNARPVIATNILSGEEKLYGSGVEARLDIGIPSGSISRCCSGKYKSSHGYMFRYAEE